MRVLLVDDDDFIRLFLSNVLCRLGIVEEAKNGREAVQKFEEARKTGNPYSVVFMDYQMPVMDGCEALCNMRKLEKEQPLGKLTTICISSSHGGCKEHFSGLLALDTHVHFIDKPFNFARFFDYLKLLNI